MSKFNPFGPTPTYLPYMPSYEQPEAPFATPFDVSFDRCVYQDATTVRELAKWLLEAAEHLEESK